MSGLEVPRRSQVQVQPDRDSDGINRIENFDANGNLVNVTFQLQDSQPELTQPEREALEAKRQADIAAENSRIEAERLERDRRIEAERVNRNTRMDNAWAGRTEWQTNDSITVKPGTGYHFNHNWKSDDGNYYTTFKSNRGSNEKYYSLSEHRWISDYVMYVRRCSNCERTMRGLLKQYDFTCINCGTVLPKGN